MGKPSRKDNLYIMLKGVSVLTDIHLHRLRNYYKGNIELSPAEHHALQVMEVMILDIKYGYYPTVYDYIAELKNKPRYSTFLTEHNVFRIIGVKYFENYMGIKKQRAHDLKSYRVSWHYKERLNLEMFILTCENIRYINKKLLWPDIQARTAKGEIVKANRIRQMLEIDTKG